MKQQIKNITGPDQYEKIFGLFKKLNVFVYAENKHIQVEFLDFSNNGVTIRSKIIKLKNDKNAIVLYVRIKDQTIIAYNSLISQENDVYFLKPEKVQVFLVPRKEKRLSAKQSGNTENLFISEILSELSLKDILASEKRKIENIKLNITENIQSHFDYVKVYFVNETRSDPRIKYFQKHIKPIYIKDLMARPHDEEMGYTFDIFKNDILKEDRTFKTENLVSEISVPIVYRSLLLVGYLRANKKTTLMDEEINTVRKLGVAVSESFAKYNVIKTANDKVLVIDYSKNGLGLVFKGRKFLRHFQKDRYVMFTLSLPNEKKVPMLVIVRNINFMENNNVRIGCEIINIDAIGEAFYDSFLEENS